MLPKRQKLQLRQKQDFFDQAQKSFHALFTLFYLKNQTSFLPAVIVPKKVARKATKRNALKRQVYKILEENYTELTKKQVGVAIVLKPKAAGVSEQEIATALLRSLLKL